MNIEESVHSLRSLWFIIHSFDLYLNHMTFENFIIDDGFSFKNLNYFTLPILSFIGVSRGSGGSNI